MRTALHLIGTFIVVELQQALHTSKVNFRSMLE